MEPQGQWSGADVDWKVGEYGSRCETRSRCGETNARIGVNKIFYQCDVVRGRRDRHDVKTAVEGVGPLVQVVFGAHVQRVKAGTQSAGRNGYR